MPFPPRLTRRAAAAACVVALPAASPVRVAAQPPAATPAADTAGAGPRVAALRAALADVAPGTRVRIAWRDGSPAISGRVERLAGDTLVARVPRAPEATRAALDAVHALEVRTGTLAGRGGRLGADFGALVLGGLGAIAIRGLCDTSDCSFTRAEWTGVALGTALGAAGGAAVGALVGGAVPRWRVVRP